MMKFPERLIFYFTDFENKTDIKKMYSKKPVTFISNCLDSKLLSENLLINLFQDIHKIAIDLHNNSGLWFKNRIVSINS